MNKEGYEFKPNRDKTRKYDRDTADENQYDKLYTDYQYRQEKRQ